MAQCELCGKSVEKTQVSRIEGVEMNVCGACAPLGTKPPQFKFKKHSNVPKFMGSDEVVVSDFGSLIRNAREKRNMKQVEFAKLLSLKESQVHQFESGSRSPTVETAKKMQKILHVALVTHDTGEDFELPNPEAQPKQQGFTLGDMIKIKKK